MKYSKTVLLLILSFWILASEKLLACSSCGSGAADPVVLNPLERQKLYLGLSVQSGFRDFDHRGELRPDYGPEQQRRLEVAFAQRVSPTLFVSLDGGLGENRRGSRVKHGLTDTTINSRWNAWTQDVTKPWLPQVQMVLSHRFKTTRSVQDAREENYLDSFGAGYDETFAGTDIWFGMWPLMFGGSLLFSKAWESSTKSGRLEAGPSRKAIATLGFMPFEEWKLIGGAIFDRRGAIRLDDHELPESDKRSQDLFLTWESLLKGTDNFRFSFVKKGAFGSHKNAVLMRAYTLAWLRTL